MPTWKPVTMHLGQYFTILAAYRIAYWSAMACLTLMVNGQLSIQPLKHHMPAIVDRQSATPLKLVQPSQPVAPPMVRTPSRIAVNPQDTATGLCWARKR